MAKNKNNKTSNKATDKTSYQNCSNNAQDMMNQVSNMNDTTGSSNYQSKKKQSNKATDCHNK